MNSAHSLSPRYLLYTPCIINDLIDDVYRECDARRSLTAELSIKPIYVLPLTLVRIDPMQKEKSCHLVVITGEAGPFNYDKVHHRGEGRLSKLEPKQLIT